MVMIDSDGNYTYEMIMIVYDWWLLNDGCCVMAHELAKIMGICDDSVKKRSLWIKLQ